MPKTKQFDESEILKKAQEIFNEKGYNGTSMDILVKATGLSRSSIYDTFGDKHGLFVKSLNQYVSDKQSNVDQILISSDSAKQKIATLFYSLIQEIIEDKKKRGCLLLNSSVELTCTDEKIAVIAHRGIEDMESLFFKIITQGQSSGEISITFDATYLAKFFYNSFAGLRVTGQSRPDRRILNEVVKIILSILK